MNGALDGVRLNLVDSMDKLWAARCWAGERRPGPLGFDTESGGLNPHRDEHRLTQLGDLRAGWAFPPGWAGAAAEILSTYPGELVAHNSPYDWRVLSVHQGLTPRWERTHDTLLGGHIMDSIRLAALKPRSAIEIDPRAMAGEKVLEEGMRAQHWTWATVPQNFEPWWTYGALDPVLAAHLWDKWGKSLTGEFSESYELERATARICASMMSTGMLIDRPFIGSKITEMLEFYDKAMAWLRHEFGLTTVNSNDQVGSVLNRIGVPTLVFTDGGKPAIGKEVLKFYASTFPDQAPVIEAIARCRKTDSVVNRYLQKFLAMADGDTMHYQIWTSRARTSRMSVTDPPMQTFDRDEPAIRGGYIPRPGHVFISIDADQIEARLAAHCSGDAAMIQSFHLADESGIDFFRIMTGQVYQEPPDKISKKDYRRQLCKNSTYGQIYGGGLEKVAATAGVPIDQMRPVYMAFQQLYPGVNRLMNQLIYQGKRGGGRPEVRTMMGRRLYADRGHEYALLNYLIQGSAAEIMKRGLISLDAAGFGPYLRLPIHDEILIEAPQEYAEEMLRVASGILTDRANYAVPITWAGSILPERWKKT